MISDHPLIKHPQRGRTRRRLDPKTNEAVGKLILLAAGRLHLGLVCAANSTIAAIVRVIKECVVQAQGGEESRCVHTRWAREAWAATCGTRAAARGTALGKGRTAQGKFPRGIAPSFRAHGYCSCKRRRKVVRVQPVLEDKPRRAWTLRLAILSGQFGCSCAGLRWRTIWLAQPFYSRTTTGSGQILLSSSWCLNSLAFRTCMFFASSN
mmetsp:Transcript_70532/g.114607  ORF Transcript_70532/g.114607 Transcript_70532/m.114607 type:complete len:209 (+) Transcript_70532:1350-1976(+)